MVCTRSASLLLGVLLLIVTLEESIAQSYRGIASFSNRDQVVKGHLEHSGEAMKSAAATSKRPTGRKKGLEYVRKKEQTKMKYTINTGKSRNNSEKLIGLSNPNAKEQDIDGTTVKKRPLTTPQGINNQDNRHTFKATSARDNLGSLQQSKPSVSNEFHDQFQTKETQKLQKATSEILNMLNKDYYSQARPRSPIHNDLPLEDNDVEP